MDEWPPAVGAHLRVQSNAQWVSRPCWDQMCMLKIVVTKCSGGPHACVGVYISLANPLWAGYAW